MSSKQPTKDINLGIRRYRPFVPTHRAIGTSMVLFGAGVWINPAFPYQGDLLQLHPLMPYVYAVLFIVGGAGLLPRRPRPLRYLILTAPLFIHLVGVVVDVTLTAFPRLLPVTALYGLLLALLIKAYWDEGRAVYG